MLRHIIIFKYKQTADDGRIRLVADAFYSMAKSIPGILSFEHGVNSSPEGKDRGFTHVYVLTFTDEQSRDAYLPHPVHQRFIESLAQLQIVEDIFVIDYSPQTAS